MDPMLVATPDPSEIADAMWMWPELNTGQVRPLLVSAFGDIFAERATGGVFVASPIELTCQRVADTVEDLARQFSDPEWGRQVMRVDLALRAQAEGASRPPGLVFALAPHPVLAGSVWSGKFVPMSLRMWHSIALQSGQQAPSGPNLG